jgi:hypothetical protein
MRLLELEWGYLSDDCKALATHYMVAGVCDVEVAVEMAIAKLGDEAAFVLEDKGVS